ncbi:uncharacterized protein LOC119551394 [Drosophila subpulchrella]|uniref:uncharacterized protein LOC119551394 n=1 Tax=Drosophila subpulchrella TaxID=1486046 RepID=UPI0018A14134|nr:uncharacterized protein LOC119551394 [Drosophila subpulchrella]
MFSHSVKMSNAIFWLQLRTFGLVVGWLEVIFFTMSTIYWGSISLLEHYKRHEKSETGHAIRNSFYLAFNVSHLLSSSLLIFGTIRERHHLLFPWLINRGIVLFGSIMLTIYYIKANDSLPFLQCLVFILFNCFLFSGIYSLLNDIEASNELPRLRLDTPDNIEEKSLSTKLDWNSYVHQYKFQPSLYEVNFPDNGDTDNLLKRS